MSAVTPCQYHVPQTVTSDVPSTLTWYSSRQQKRKKFKKKESHILGKGTGKLRTYAFLNSREALRCGGCMNKPTKPLLPRLETVQGPPTIVFQGVPSWAHYRWLQKRSVSVWCWLPDHTAFRNSSPRFEAYTLTTHPAAIFRFPCLSVQRVLQNEFYLNMYLCVTSFKIKFTWSLR